MRSAPTKEWTYRDIDCRIYEHPKPDGSKLVGYAKIGDKWTEVVEKEDAEVGDVRGLVENNVDMIIIQALKEDDPRDDKYVPNIWPKDDEDYPSPTPAPTPTPAPWDPDPEPINPGPVWVGRTYTTSGGSGTTKETEAFK